MKRQVKKLVLGAALVIAAMSMAACGKESGDVKVDTDVEVETGDVEADVDVEIGDVEADVDVETGDVVEKGQQIGQASDSAESESEDGKHLHFEMFKNGTKVDPSNYLNISGK